MPDWETCSECRGTVELLKAETIHADTLGAGSDALEASLQKRIPLFDWLDRHRAEKGHKPLKERE